MNLANLIPAGHTRLRAAAAIIALAVAAGFLFSAPRTGDVAPAEEPKAANPATPFVSLRDSFKNGIHTITGSVEAPDACATAVAQASLEGDTPKARRIVVAISLESGAGVCLQLPTRTNFSATIAAPAGVPLSAAVNGVSAATAP